MTLPVSFRTVLIPAALVLLSGCGSSLVIHEVDYSQPIESVVTPAQDGTVTDQRYGVAFNILPLQFSETGDTASVTTSEVRLIRGEEGLYYLTAPGYRHVYILAPERSSLKLERKIMIDREGIDQPAFNQRNGRIQLLSRSDSRSWYLAAEGVVRGEEE